MNFDSLVSDTIANVVGGIALALLFFLAKEKWFPLPDVGGQWYLEMCTMKTSYRPYELMIVRYIAILWGEGNKIGGTVEKVYERTTIGEKMFVGVERTRGVVEGHLEKRYLSKDRLLLHVVEKGQARESTHFYELTIGPKQVMMGQFRSTAADQSGATRWQRDPF